MQFVRSPKATAVVALALAALFSTHALAVVTPVTISPPSYGPMQYSVALVAGDTIQVIVPGGFTAIRVWTTAADGVTSLRLWRLSTTVGTTETLAVVPLNAANDYRYLLMGSSTTMNGWNEYTGVSASRFTLRNATAGTLTLYAEVR
jgi:hypothetical protein